MEAVHRIFGGGGDWPYAVYRIFGGGGDWSFAGYFKGVTFKTDYLLGSIKILSIFWIL